MKRPEPRMVDGICTRTKSATTRERILNWAGGIASLLGIGSVIYFFPQILINLLLVIAHLEGQYP